MALNTYEEIRRVFRNNGVPRSTYIISLRSMLTSYETGGHLPAGTVTPGLMTGIDLTNPSLNAATDPVDVQALRLLIWQYNEPSMLALRLEYIGLLIKTVRDCGDSIAVAELHGLVMGGAGGPGPRLP